MPQVTIRYWTIIGKTSTDRFRGNWSTLEDVLKNQRLYGIVCRKKSVCYFNNYSINFNYKTTIEPQAIAYYLVI